ncbi:MAG TPA: ABC-2 family transporter protein [Mycobacteriales bacterium]|nr:ABC-2 family transporter protein [Mycobacteriales bacterium]
MRAVLSQVRIGFRSPWAYRGATLLSMVVLAAQIAFYAVVWRAIYRGRSGTVAGADVNSTVAYVILGMTVASVLNLWPGRSISERVREGLIGIDLLRPIGLLTQTLALQVGNVLANLPQALIGIGMGFALGGMVPAHDAGAVAVFVPSLLLAFAVSQLITLLMALSSFWTMEVGGTEMLFAVVRTFLSGTVIPLWFMPGWLQAIAGVLPFQAATFTPLAIYFGRPPGGIAVALGVQAGWVVVLFLLCVWVWSRARTRVVVQGG